MAVFAAPLLATALSLTNIGSTSGAQADVNPPGPSSDPTAYHDWYNCIGNVHWSFIDGLPCAAVFPSTNLSDGEQVQMTGVNYPPAACDISGATAGSKSGHSGCVPSGSSTDVGFKAPWSVKITECTFQMMTDSASAPDAYTNYCDASTLFNGSQRACAKVSAEGTWGPCTLTVHQVICPGEAPCVNGQGGISCTDDPATNPITSGSFSSNFAGSTIESMCVLLAGSFSGDSGGGHYLFFPGGKDYTEPPDRSCYVNGPPGLSCPGPDPSAPGTPPPLPPPPTQEAGCGGTPRGPGTVVAWGSDTSGQLGLGSTGNGCLAPTPVSDLSNIVALSNGFTYGLALDGSLGRGGHVWAWGSGSLGTDPSTTTPQSSTPREVLAPNGTCCLGDGHGGDGPIVGVSAAPDHALAVDANGHVWAWGTNSEGDLGDGQSPSTANPSAGDSPTPVEVLAASGSGALSNITQVAAGPGESRALDRDGHVWAWGTNCNGELGDGSADCSAATVTAPAHPVPTEVMDGNHVVSSASALADIAAITQGKPYALTSNGWVVGWGSDAGGTLGDGTAGDSDPHTATVQPDQRWTYPVRILTPGAIGIAQVAAANSPEALTAKGSLYSWTDQTIVTAENYLPNVLSRLVPIPLGSVGSAVGVASGANQGFAIRSDGTVISWGGYPPGFALTLGRPATASYCEISGHGIGPGRSFSSEPCFLDPPSPVLLSDGSPLTNVVQVAAGQAVYAIIGRAPTTVRTSVLDVANGASWTGAEQAGASAEDTAAVGGQPSGTPATGTVTYSLFHNGACSGTPVSTQTLTLNPDGTVPNSTPTGALSAGHYAYKATYSGDANYRPATGPCEPFTVQLPISVFAGYVDNLHLGPSGAYSGPFVPSPWQGSTATIFVGCNRNVSGHKCSDIRPSTKKACPNIAGSVPQDCYDAGAIRIANATSTAIPLTRITVTIGGCTFNPWAGEPASALTVPAHGQLILTQSGGLEPNTGCGFGPDPQTPYNFDTSDTSPHGSCTATGYIPLVSLTTSLGTFLYHDTGQVLNHGGVDPSCTSKNANERTNWSALAS